MKRSKEKEILDDVVIGTIRRNDAIEFAVVISEEKGKRVVRLGVYFLNKNGNRKRGATAKIFVGELGKVIKLLNVAKVRLSRPQRPTLLEQLLLPSNKGVRR